MIGLAFAVLLVVAVFAEFADLALVLLSPKSESLEMNDV